MLLQAHTFQHQLRPTYGRMEMKWQRVHQRTEESGDSAEATYFARAATVG